MKARQALEQVLAEFDLNRPADDPGVQRDVNDCAEGSILAAADLGKIARTYIRVNVDPRHAECPEDCIMPGIQFYLELVAAAMWVSKTCALPMERKFRDESLPRRERLLAVGRWTTFLMFSDTVAEPRPKSVTGMHHVSEIREFLTLLADKWPEICTDIYANVMVIDVPETTEGIE